MRIQRWAEIAADKLAPDHLSRGHAGARAWVEIAAESRPFFLAAEYLQQPRKMLILTSGYERGLQWQARLQLCGVPETAIRQLPSGQSALFEDASPETVALSDRIGSLRSLLEPGPGIVIATISAALERTLPREALSECFLRLEKGMSIEMDKLVKTLLTLGYEVSEPVRIPGQYSLRGGILDVFPMGYQLPIRIEFFGEDIDSLRQFDPNTQRSISPINSMEVSSSRETLYYFPHAETPDEIVESRRGLGDMIRQAMEFESANLEGYEARTRLEELVTGDIDALTSGIFFDRLDLYRPLLHPDTGCALDLLPEDGLVVLDDPGELEIAHHRSEEELSSALKAREARGEILHSVVSDFIIGVEHVSQFENRLALTSLGSIPSWFGDREIVEFGVASLDSYRGRAENMAIDLKKWIADGMRIVVSTDQPSRCKAILNQIEAFPIEEFDPLGAEVIEPGAYLVQGNLAGGFSSQAMKFGVLTDQELFGVGRLKLPQRKFSEGVPLATVLDLKPGDYVVHIQFGIGIYQGLVKRTTGGVEKECLYIQYAGPDKLFVPADQLDRVQKFLTAGDVEPKIHRLNSGEWQRAVGKAREGAREFARDLIRLYAQRRKSNRPSFGGDSPWQAEMEATFPWQETPSQMAAIKEVKRDLQTDYPMDRLICGDVGFGKTEVAIRGAFKVAQSGKQVVVLCPTTILSEQHYRNFQERLGAFPTRLDILNRFRTSAERKEVLKKLEDGEIDIIIGTHALLNDSIKFKDLGLAVIDEEHKFGVKQKETLKELRTNVDVLSMSATPIPRTLSMALMDIREMSLINDPPPGRLPIRTFVRPYASEVVREAVLRELARGGQVYYVFNRVTGIYHVAEKLKQLVPMARIGVAHGQMSENELEPIMVAFIRGELDILVSTTIIENGLDIPNANTMVVENADKLGLSQLYQLRGRVGRSDRQAYAYLLYQRDSNLSENAMARLQSLQEFSSLGTGYSLAFRDLQIRGAGDLLGAKQSGTMNTVGYELYTRIIAEELEFLKHHADGGTPSGRSYRDPLEGLEPLPTVDLPVKALVPEEYIPDQAQRLFCYQSMMSSRTFDELKKVQEETEDRYGPSPAEVVAAYSIMNLRMRAKDLFIKKIDGQGGRLVVDFTDDVDLPPRLWSIMARKNRGAGLARQQYVWPFAGSPIDACSEMLRTMDEGLKEIEKHLTSAGL